MTPRLTAAALTALLLAAAVACGGDDTPDSTAFSSATTTAAPNCADVFAEGQVPELDEVSPQCTDPDGTLRILGTFRCADGTYLVTVDKNTGAPSAGWYLSGQPFHPADDVAGDPAYSEAYKACNQ